jgi:hypothetical protein
LFVPLVLRAHTFGLEEPQATWIAEEDLDIAIIFFKKSLLIDLELRDLIIVVLIHYFPK